MTWNGNRQAQAEADAAWQRACQRRVAKREQQKRQKNRRGSGIFVGSYRNEHEADGKCIDPMTAEYLRRTNQSAV